ncbi:site-specific integrase [Candidatus Bathyarchaeota archaeon]|jgi:integrase|nr:site-specific integrase [Candidatus Bathyarchaeota archaeon]
MSLALTIANWGDYLPSESTRKLYTSWIQEFCDYYNVSPSATLKWSKAKILKACKRFLNYLQKERHKVLAKERGFDVNPLSGSSVLIARAALQRWYVDADRDIRIKLKGVRARKTYFDYIPSQEDMKLIFDECKLKYKLAFSLIAYSGMRPIDVVNLTFENIKRSYNRGDDILEITLRQRKTKEWYTTFLAQEGTDYLKRFLEMRRNAGEYITDESYIVTITGKQTNTGTLRGYFNSTIEGIMGKHPTGEKFRHFRLYGLRKYFRKTIGGSLSESECEFLMGHTKGIESLSSVYSGLRDMDIDALGKLKEKYRSVAPQLQSQTKAQESIIDALKRELEKYRQEYGAMGGGKAIKSEWDADTILAALQSALTNGQA